MLGEAVATKMYGCKPSKLERTNSTVEKKRIHYIHMIIKRNVKAAMHTSRELPLSTAKSVGFHYDDLIVIDSFFCCQQPVLSKKQHCFAGNLTLDIK